MKVYLIQEDYECQQEDSYGEVSDVRRAEVVAVCLSREAMLKALADVVTSNAEEYYSVDIDDYDIHEVEVGDKGYLTNDYKEFSWTKLTDEERASVEQEITRLTNERIEKYGG